MRNLKFFEIFLHDLYNIICKNKEKKMKIQFHPEGVCCQQMFVDIEDNKINEAMFLGGCNGNLQGIAKLIKGMDINDVIEKLEGVNCGGKGTSCPDQLAKGLKEYIRLSENGELQKISEQ